MLNSKTDKKEELSEAMVIIDDVLKHPVFITSYATKQFYVALHAIYNELLSLNKKINENK